MQLLTPFIALLGVTIGKLLAGDATQLPLARTIMQLFASYTSFVDLNILSDLRIAALLSEVVKLPMLQVCR